MRPELRVENEVVDWARAQSILPLKLNLIGNTGWPDRLWLFVYPRIAFIEFKAPGRPLTGDRNQPERLAELAARGYPVGVFDNVAEAITFLETYVLSDHWRGVDDQPSLRRLAVEAREREDQRRLCGVSHPSRKRIRK